MSNGDIDIVASMENKLGHKGTVIGKVTYPRQSLPLPSLQVQQQQLLSPLEDRRRGEAIVGRVRATPPGHMLGSSSSSSNVERWDDVRSMPNKHIDFAREGFDHVLGASEVRVVDGTPVGGRIVELDDLDAVAWRKRRGRRPGTKTVAAAAAATATRGLSAVLSMGAGSFKQGAELEEQEDQEQEPRLEPEEEEALRAELASRRLALSRMEETGLLDDIDESTHCIRRTSSRSAATTTDVTTDGHEYGASRTPLDAPIGSLREKWRVLPHFLKLRGLMKQHIDSFDHFVNVEMKQIVQSPSACEIRSDHDPKFYLRYTDCWVGEPSIDEDSYATIRPHRSSVGCGTVPTVHRYM